MNTWRTTTTQTMMTEVLTRMYPHSQQLPPSVTAVWVQGVLCCRSCTVRHSCVCMQRMCAGVGCEQGV